MDIHSPAERGNDQPAAQTQTQTRLSTHERVMADSAMRRAYFRPVEGFLRAKSSHPDTDRILAVLDDHQVYYLHQPETSRPRPTLFWGGNISIGLAEITEAVERIAAQR